MQLRCSSSSALPCSGAPAENLGMCCRLHATGRQANTAAAQVHALLRHCRAPGGGQHLSCRCAFVTPAGHFEAANTASLEAVAQRVPGAPVEHAKLLWAMVKPHRAIIEMQEVLSSYMSLIFEKSSSIPWPVYLLPVVSTYWAPHCSAPFPSALSRYDLVNRGTTRAGDRAARGGRRRAGRRGGPAGLCDGGGAQAQRGQGAHAAGLLDGGDGAGLPRRHRECVLPSSSTLLSLLWALLGVRIGSVKGAASLCIELATGQASPLGKPDIHDVASGLHRMCPGHGCWYPNHLSQCPQTTSSGPSTWPASGRSRTSATPSSWTSS